MVSNYLLKEMHEYLAMYYLIAIADIYIGYHFYCAGNLSDSHLLFIEELPKQYFIVMHRYRYQYQYQHYIFVVLD